MFCSTCGAAISENLNYCSRCGNELGGAGKEFSTQIESLIWAIVSMTIAGIGVTIGLIVVLKNVVGLSNEIITLVTLVGLFMVIAANATFIWMLLKKSRAEEKPEKNTQLKPAETQKLIEMPARAELNEAMPMPSVVEDTTRNLEPVKRN